jgi:hypothetical protein
LGNSAIPPGDSRASVLSGRNRSRPRWRLRPAKPAPVATGRRFRLASASIPPNTSQSADVTPVRLPLRQTVFAPNVATKGHKDGFDEIAACTPAPLIGKMNLHFSSCISVSVMTAERRAGSPASAPRMGAVRTLDLDRLVMAWPLIDLRNIYPTKEMTRANFRYSRRATDGGA